jgi:Tfp pilus assembly protein PilF
MTREEHLAWAKERAHEYLDRGDLAQAVTSMGSDLNKHPELASVGNKMMSYGIFLIQQRDFRGIQRWIDGFN